MFVTHTVFVFTQCQGKQKSDVSLSFLVPYNFACLMVQSKAKFKIFGDEYYCRPFVIGKS